MHLRNLTKLSRNFTFLTNQEFLLSGPFQNFYSLADSRMFTLWTIHIFFKLFIPSRIITFWTVPEFLRSGPFKNFYVLDHSRIFTFLTIPQFLCSGPFQNYYIMDHSTILHSWPFQNLHLSQVAGVHGIQKGSQRDD